MSGGAKDRDIERSYLKGYGVHPGMESVVRGDLVRNYQDLGFHELRYGEPPLLEWHPPPD